MRLGGVGGPSVAAPLIAALKDEDPKVRFGAALALATVAAYSADGDARAVAAVKHAAAVEDDPEMRAAMDMLRFTPPDVT